MKKTFTAAAIAIALATGAFVNTARAAGDAPKPPERQWTFHGVFGTYDRAAAQRGFQVYREVCASCHSLRLLSYRNLAAIGFSEAQIKKIAGDAEVTDGPNAEGDMFTRPAIPSDRFAKPFANDNAARAANGGALPPDLSLMTKARKGGADYLYALLAGYKDEAPQGFTLMEGMNYNTYFPGHQIAMPPPLAEGAVEYTDGTKATIAQMSEDVTVFLAWAAEPEMEERKRMGIKVLLFLIVLTAMLYAMKRQIWKDVH